MSVRTPKKLRFAIIGLGRFARKNFLTSLPPNVHLVAIVDPAVVSLDEPTRTHLAAEGVHLYGDLNVMLAREDLDFAVVSTPHDQHYPILKRLIGAGVDVLKEKPLAIDLATARATMSLMRRHPERRAMVLPKRRLSPLYQTLHRSLPLIGRPFMYQMEYTLAVESLAEGWRARRAQAGGGCLIDMGYHYVDLMTWLFGEPSVVDCRLSFQARPTQAYDVEDSCILSTRHRSGLIGSLVLSRCSPPERELVAIYGTSGTIVADASSVKLTTAGVTQTYSFTPDELKVNVIAHFADVLAGTSMPLTTLAEQFVNQRVIDACYRADARHAGKDLEHAIQLA